MPDDFRGIGWLRTIWVKHQGAGAPEWPGTFRWSVTENFPDGLSLALALCLLCWRLLEPGSDGRRKIIVAIGVGIGALLMILFYLAVT